MEGATVGLLIVVALLAQATSAPVAPPPCGPASLYVICRMAGVEAELGRVEGLFPVATPAGHSMAEIQAAGKAMGLSLVGVEAPKGTWPVDGPAIAFLDKGGHGHFVVVRPVGHSGKLVQVVDGGHSVEVLDRSALVARPDWTGLALVPSRRSAARAWFIAGAMIPAGWIASRLFVTYFRKVRVAQPG